MLFLLILFLKYIFFIENNFEINDKIISKVDITYPKFSINNKKQNIIVTANEGNFVDKDIILLQKNVMFKSEDFSIITEKVVFDRKRQTASSEENSIFKSKKTKILSEGFDIYDNGNKIKFLGNSIIIIK